MRDYSRFFSGIIPHEWTQEPLPETLSLEQSHQIATLGSSRALYMALVEEREEEALAELATLQTLLQSQLAQHSDESERIFLIGAVDAINNVVKAIEQESKFSDRDLSLPQSANEFLIYNAKRERTKNVPDFRVLLRERICHYLALYFANNDTVAFTRRPNTGTISAVEAPSAEKAREIIDGYFDNIYLYRAVEREDTPIYWEAKEKLQDLGADHNVVFGRDGRFFFTALKANDFGIKNNVLKYVIITRNIQAHETQQRIGEYLKQNGVTLDFTFIDTGYRGSIPELAINTLGYLSNTELSQADIDKKIMLLSSHVPRRKELSHRRRSQYQQEGAISNIEERPQPFESPSYFEMGDRGRLKPIKNPRDIGAQLKAWTVEHAVMRNFAPRLEPDQSVRYIRENPLEGCKFISSYHGNYIGTHPLELWEDKDKNKFLLKSGPRHTIQADYVGYCFLTRLGVKTPKTELVEIDGELRLRMEFLEGWEGGTIKLPKQYHQSKQIQEGFFADMLLGQYDRTPWNFMFHPDGKQVAFIDHGGSLYSRARGGYKGFADHFDVEELADLLTNPQFAGMPVNEAYQNLVEAKDGKVVVKNVGALDNALNLFKTCTDKTAIEIIIESARLSDGRHSEEESSKRIAQLEKELEHLTPDSSDYRKAKSAIETFKKIIEAGGEATYLKEALWKRRQDIIVLFQNAITSEISKIVTSEQNKKK